MKRMIRLTSMILSVCLCTTAFGVVLVSDKDIYAQAAARHMESGLRFEARDAGIIDESDIVSTSSVGDESDVESGDESGVISRRRGSKRYDSAYDKYSTNYVYNQLTGNKREVWDELDELCADLISGGNDLAEGNVGYVEYDGSKMTGTEACYLVYLFQLTNPQYFFLKSEMYYGSDSLGKTYVTILVYDDFRNGSARLSAAADVFGTVDAVISESSSLSTDEEKVDYFSTAIASSVVYAANSYDQSAYSAVCLGQTVCAGYSLYMSLLCNGAGIDCVCVTSPEHAWNKVRLNDNWYNVDVTFADSETPGQVFYDYYLRSDAKYSSLSYASYHEADGFWKGYIIKCKLDSGSSMYTKGTIPDVTSKVKKPVVKYKKVSDGYKVTITCKTKGAIIYYSKSGKPSVASTRCYRYKKSFTVKTLAKAKKIKAIAVKPGMKDSKVSKAKKS